MPFRFRNISDEAEIDEGDAVIRQHQEIAGVGIGLIKAEVEYLFEKCIEEARGGALQVDIRRQKMIDFI